MFPNYFYIFLKYKDRNNYYKQTINDEILTYCNSRYNSVNNINGIMIENINLSDFNKKFYIFKKYKKQNNEIDHTINDYLITFLNSIYNKEYKNPNILTL